MDEFTYFWLVTVYYSSCLLSICCLVSFREPYLLNFFCLVGIIFFIVLVRDGCHGYTVLCLKFIACGFCWCASSWWNISPCWCTITSIWLCLKLALTRATWAYNIMGKYLWKNVIYSLETVKWYLHSWKIYHFLSSYHSILIPFKYIID